MDQQYSPLEIQALKMMSLRCKWDLFYLAKYILGYDLMEEEVHGDLCKYAESLYEVHPPEWTPPDEKQGSEMEDQFKYGNKNLLLLMPRGTFKSSVITIGYALQAVLHNPNVRILIDSETFTKSKAFLREIKGHLEDNEKYRTIFYFIHGVYPNEGKKRELLWTDSKVNLSCRTRQLKEPTFSCGGVDVTNNGMHYDLIIADDLHSEKNVTNKEQIEQVIEHWKLSYSLLDPGRPMIVIGTRWDYNDLYQHILDNERETFNILIRRAIQADGTLLFPNRLTREFLESIKRKQGSRIYSAQYLNEPVDDETATFKRSNIKHKNLDEIEGMPMNWYLSIDPSYEGEYSDYAALVVCGMNYQRDYYVRHIIRDKMTYSQIIDNMFLLYNRYFPKYVILETIGQQKTIQVELLNQMRRRSSWLPLREIKGQRKSKEDRIRGLAPLYEYGNIYHVRGCPQEDELEYELIHFPRGKHDDVVDALATILEYASPPSPKARDIHQRNDEGRKPLVYIPRNPITGV